MTILCATDFSACSRTATQLATAMARRLGDSIVLLHAVDLTMFQPADVPMATTGWEQTIRDAAEVELNRVAETIRGAGIQTETRILFGSPTLSILETARAMAARMIVVGTHGRKGAAYFFLGSVAEQIVHCSPCPVLVSRENGRGLAPLSSGEHIRVAVAADGTRASDAAFSWLDTFARSNSCAVTVVRVFFPPRELARYGLEEPWPAGSALPDLGQLLERDLQRQMEPSIGRLAPQLRLRAASRDTADALVDEIAVLAPDLVVLGVPRDRPENWTALTPDGVLRASPIPILCVPEAAESPRQRIPVTRTVLIATDLSEAARSVLGPAYGLLRPNGGQVELCYVHQRGSGQGLPDDSLSPRLGDEERAEVEARLRLLVPTDAEALGITTRVSVLEGHSAADAILQAAQRLDADVIALASRGRTGIMHAVLGPVAEDVARQSSRPVLIVHASGNGA